MKELSNDNIKIIVIKDNQITSKESKTNKDKFYKEINRGRYPKYIFSQIKEGKPHKDCASIVLTESGSILLAKYENNKWQQAHFTHASSDTYPSQDIYYTDIKEKVIYWTDGEAKDYSRKQNEE